MDLDVLGLGRFGDEDIGEYNGDDEDDDDDDHTLSDPTFGLPHPGDAMVFLLLSLLKRPSVMMVRHNNLLKFFITFLSSYLPYFRNAS